MIFMHKKTGELYQAYEYCLCDEYHREKLVLFKKKHL